MKFKNSYLSYLMMYLFYYMSLALFSVLIAVYLTSKQLSSVDIATVISVGLFSLLGMQSLIGYLNDTFNGKKVNMMLLASTTIGALIFIQMFNVWTLALTYSFVYALLFGVNPAIEAMAMSSPFRYGRIRVWGTIGFAIGAQVAGLIYYYVHPDVVYLLYIATIFMCLIGFWAIDSSHITRRHKQPEQHAFLSMFKHKHFVIYLLTVLLFYGTLSVSGTYIPNLLIREGIDINMTASIVSLAVLVELPLVLFSHLFMDKLKSKHLLYSVFILEIIQFMVYAFIPNVWLKVIATLLFKHTLGMVFVMTNLKIVRNLMPSHIQVSALALVATMGSLSAIFLQNVAGYMIKVYSYETGYTVLIGFVGLAMVLFSCFRITDRNDMSLFN